jgi:integrase
MWYQYLQINSPDEVNVSSTAREQLKSQLDQWAPNAKVISKLVARNCLETDSDHRIAIFEIAFREILTMLYQNLWTKFRVEEAQALTLEDEDNDGVMFVFKKEKRRIVDRKAVKDSCKDSEKESRSTVLQAISEIGSGKDDGSVTPL